MMIRFPKAPSREKDTLESIDSVQPIEPGSNAMRWETPKATDFRFGMEITMYIARR
jgi:coenzyme PQQ precursor peptide PqqA